jgi:hypothetical protein
MSGKAFSIFGRTKPWGALKIPSINGIAKKPPTQSLATKYPNTVKSTTQIIR